ncbi:MAG: recombinase family protein [Clostridia bacterium]|nr:recombinase family protein [Clostridia bacterium]
MIFCLAVINISWYDLHGLGIDEKKIFCEKKSGKDFERKEYMRLMRKLRSGDLLVIKSIDRLGRNYESIISEWSNITHKIGANIVVLDMPLLDTREKAGTLVGKFIADIVLQVLSFVAENERANIRARQAEGIALAKQLGTRFGRPKKAFSPDFIKVAEDYNRKRITLPEALEILKMKQSTFFYHFGSYTCCVNNEDIG